MWFKFLDCELTFDSGTFFWVEFYLSALLCGVGTRFNTNFLVEDSFAT